MVKNLPAVERSTKIRFGKHVPDSTDQAENTIVFNASNTLVPTINENAVYLSPIRNRPDFTPPEVVLLMYDKVTKEITESGESANALVGGATLSLTVDRANVTSNTVQFKFAENNTGFVTDSNVGISNLLPQHTVSVGSNLYIDEFGSNVLVVSGNVAILRDLVVDGNFRVNGDTTVIYTENTAIKDAFIELGADNITGDTTLDLGILMHRPDDLSNVVLGYREEVAEFAIAYTDAKPTDKIFTPKSDEDINVHVYGLTHIDANIYAHEDLLVSGNVYVSQNVSVTEELTVSGNVYTQKDVEILGNTYVSGNVSTYKDLLVSGNAYVSQNVFVTEELTVSGNVYTQKDVAILGNTYVSGNVSTYKDLLVSGNAYVSGNVSTYKDLLVSGNVYVSQNVFVTEELTVSGNVYTQKDVEILGNTYVSGNVSTYKDLLVSGNAYVSQNVFVTEELTVSGNVYTQKDVEILGNTYVSGNVSTYKDLLVSGNAYVSGNVNVTKQFSVSGNAYISGNVEVTNSLIVNANTYLKGPNVFITNTMDFLNPTTALVTDLTSNVLVKLNQLSNVTINTTDTNESLRENHILSYDGENWVNEYPTHTYVKVYNDSGVELKTGNVVYVVGTHNANVLEVALAKSDSPSTMPAFGVVTSDIGQSEEGVAVAYGKALISGVDDFVEGETVYVSNVHAGMLSNVKPYATDSVPNLIQNVGVVTKTGSGVGAIFVTGIGRANDVPNAQIVLDDGDINYVYVNNVNNDFKKINPSNLLTQLQTLEQVTNTGNTTSNTIQFTNTTMGIVTTGNVQVGSNISVMGLTDPANNYLPMVNTDGTFIKSPVYVTGDGKYVISASEAEFLGNITLGGNTTIISSSTVTIEDRIFGVGANNSATNLDSGFMIEHKDGEVYANIALIYHADEHRFSIGHTQNTFTDNHILHYEDPVGMLIDLRGDVLVQNNMTVNETITVTGVSTLESNLTVGPASNLFVDVSTSRVGINEASPQKSLDVNGTGRFKDTTDSDATSSGALMVYGGLGVASNIHATNVYAVSHIGVGTMATTVPLEVRASGTEGILVKHTGDTADDDAKLALEVTNSGGGDPYITMKTNSNIFAMGVDNSDSDTFKISEASSLGENDRLTITRAGVTTITNTTEATSTSLGALVVSGGLGVASNINTTNVYVLGTTAATSNTSGALQVRGGIGVQGNIYGTAATFEGITSVTNTTEATTTSSGALVVSGGLGVASNINTTNVYVLGTTAATSKASGALQVRGGVGIAGNVYAATIHTDAYLTHTGDLNTRVGFPAVDTFVVETAGSERVCVDSAGRLGVATTSPNANLHVVGNVYVSSDLTVDSGTLHVDSITNRVGLGTTEPDANLHVVGNVYVSSNFEVGTANLFVDTTTSSVGIGTTDPGYKLDVHGTSNLGALTATTVTVPSDGDFIMNSKPLVPATGMHWDRVNSRLGIGTSSPATKLHVAGGTITNSDGVAKKTYSYSGDLVNGQSIADSTITITFSQHVFYAKIVAHLVEADSEVSTLSLECGGGNWSGGTPLAIAKGPQAIFGSASTNPWDETVTTTSTTVSFKPTTTMAAAGHYNVFIEYISQSSSGVVSKITEGSTDVVTFGY